MVEVTKNVRNSRNDVKLQFAEEEIERRRLEKTKQKIKNNRKIRLDKKKRELTEILALQSQADRTTDELIRDIPVVDDRYYEEETKSDDSSVSRAEHNAIKRRLDLRDRYGGGLKETIRKATGLDEHNINDIVKLVEDVALCITMCLRETSRTNIVLSIITFAKLRFGDAPFFNMEVIEVMTEGIYAMFDDDFVEHVMDDQKEEEGTTLDSMLTATRKVRDVIENFEKYKERNIVKKVMKAIFYVISFSMCKEQRVEFSQSVWSDLIPELERKVGLPSMIYAVIDALTFVFERVLVAMKFGDASVMWTDPSTFEEWHTKAHQTILLANYLQNPEPHGIVITDYLFELEELIRRGRMISKLVEKLEGKEVKKMVVRLEEIKHNQIGLNAALKDKKAPLGMLIVGSSSIAKTSFVANVEAVFCKVNGLENKAEFKYTRTFRDKHWNNFMSYKRIIRFDDVAWMKEGGKGEIDESLIEWLQALNNVAFVPPQAAVEDKGTTPFLGMLCTMSTNTARCNLESVFSCPLAPMRRMNIVVDLQPKKEYRQEGNCKHFIDPAKIPDSVGEILDLWLIRTYKVIPADPGDKEILPENFGSGMDPRTHMNFKFEFLREYDNIFDFLAWFVIKIKEHNENQEKYMKFAESVMDYDACPACHLPRSHCRCCHFCGEYKLIHSKHKDECSLFGVVALPQQVETIPPVSDAPGIQPYNQQPVRVVGFWTLIISTIGAFLEVWKLELQLKFWERAPYVPQNVKALKIAEAKTSIPRLKEEGYKELGQLTMKYVLGDRRWITYLMLACGGIAVVASVTGLIFAMMPKHTAEEKKKIEKTIVYWSDKRVCKCSECDRRNAGVIYAHADAPEKDCECRLCHKVDEPKVIPEAEVVRDLPVELPEQVSITEIERLLEVARPPPDKLQRPNAWPKQTYELSMFELGKKTKSWKEMSTEEIIVRISKNIRRVRVIHQTETHEIEDLAQMTGVCDFMYLINKHVIGELPCEIVSYRSLANVSTTKRFTLYPEQVLQINHDTYLAFMPEFEPVKDLLDLFCNVPISTLFPVTLIALNKQCELTVNHGEPTMVQPCLSSSGEGVNATPRLMYKTTFATPTRNGDCGAPWIWFGHKGPVFVGIHTLGNSTGAAADILIADRVRSAVEKLHPTKPFDQGVLAIDPQALVEMHRKSPVNYLEDGRLTVIGSLLRRAPQYETNIVKSFAHDKLKSFGIKTKYEIPVSLGSYKPWFIGMQARTRDAQYFRPQTYRQAAESYLRMTLERRPQVDVYVLDMFAAINGLDGIEYINPLDFNTSAGYPHHCGKKKFVIGDPGSRTFTTEITDEVSNIIMLYLNGVRYNPVFTGSPKDEVLSHEKNEQGKNRIFLGSPLPWCIVVRMALLWFVKEVQGNSFDYEVAAGMNATSDEWEVAAQYLQQFGPNMIAGDYRGFDTYTDVWVAIMTFVIIIEIARRNEAPPALLNIIYGIAHDVTHNIVLFWVVMIVLFGCTPSGFPLTLIFNCLKNSIYMRSAFIELAGKLGIDIEFHTVVALLTMGDDNIMNTHGSIPWFNHTAISDVFASVGITYTMAEKDMASIPYITLEECTFVKRYFRFDPEFGCRVARLEEESIIKSLMFRELKSPLTEKDHFITVLDGALKEYSYYGREMYDDRLRFYRRIVEELGLTEYAKTRRSLFVPFEYHVEAWKKASRYTRYTWHFNKFTRIPCDYAVDVEENVTILDEQTERVLTGKWKFVRMPNPHQTKNFLVALVTGSCASLSVLTLGSAWSATISPPGRPPKVLFSTGFFGSEPNSNCSRCGYGPNPWHVQNESSEQNEPPTVSVSPTIPTLQRQAAVKPGTPGSKMQKLHSRIQKLISILESDAGEELVTLIERTVFGHFGLPPQSDVEVTSKTEEEDGDHNTEQDGLIEFMDENLGDSASYKASLRTVYDVSDNLIDLQKWFQRPLLIDTYTALLTDGFATTHSVNPWYVFFKNALNVNKLSNYAYLRCNLKIKVVISGTPFIYGREGIFYQPLQDNVGAPSTNFSTPIYNGGGAQQIVTLTQLPHLYISPHDSKGGEMTLPLVYNQNWIEIADSNATTAPNLNYLGVLVYFRMVQFASANAGSSDGITINTYCWAEDLELCGSTTSLPFQSARSAKKKKKTTKAPAKDEYGHTGTISGPASAVAALAGWFTGMPVIGPYATATQMGAKAVAAGAAALGYTNVPTIADIHPFRPTAAPPLATSEIGYPFEKLTLDPKNELTLDNSSIGLNNLDELNIQYLITKEAYLGTLSWTQAATEGTVLGGMILNPGNFAQVDSTTYSGQYAVYTVPMAYFSQMFYHWRGDIILRFDFVKSPYHKGRIAVAWEPTSSTNNITNTDSINAVLREVIDIGETDSFEVRIPYLQPTEWSEIRRLTTTNGLTVGSMGNYASPSIDNGTLVVRVTNELSAPVTTANVSILVFARAAENMEFANLANLNYSLLPPQSESSIKTKTLVLGAPSVPKPERYLTNFGEGYVSLRQILRRMSLVGVDSLTLTAGKVNMIQKIMSRFPVPYGFDPHGISSAHKIVAGSGTYGFNYSAQHPLTWVQSCFLGVRGSVNWVFNEIANSAQGNFPSSDLKAARAPSTANTASIANTAFAPADASTWAYDYYLNWQNNATGGSYTDTRVQPTLAVSLPNFTMYFFQGTNPLCASNFAYGNDEQAYDAANVTWTTDLTQQSTGTFTTHLLSMAGAGVDYNVVGFSHTPVVFIYSQVPSPN